MTLLLYLALPWLVHWGAKRLSARYRAFTMAPRIILPFWALSLIVLSIGPIETMVMHWATSLGGRIQLPYTPNTPVSIIHDIDDGLHGAGSWPGRDFITPCGTILFAPITGRVVDVGHDQYQGPWGGRNSYVLIADGSTQVMLMHGRYLVPAGTSVVQGHSIIGIEASIGNSSQCHTHMSVRVNGNLVDPIEFYRPAAQTRKPWKISYYDPALGGINCDLDCSTMADGRGWTGTDYGRTAACPPEYPLGYHLNLPGIGVVECRDRGGAIVCTEEFCWIDLMLRDRPVFIHGLLYD